MSEPGYAIDNNSGICYLFGLKMNLNYLQADVAVRVGWVGARHGG